MGEGDFRHGSGTGTGTGRPPQRGGGHRWASDQAKRVALQRACPGCNAQLNSRQ
ncbi:hypothetical protein STRTUCAR8_04467 [Streptomyces turgidiscabies Car8]|uniref:Uncharacterized protein n=1 Tax=Streptomyces turgidiscabies (strain Car8) TaxID=698760 RepID=L7FCJ3_STRT8|nr:hypothetical protein STRTUCAR8_04467 [Streptomyces turgidiscabies Car8]